MPQKHTTCYSYYSDLCASGQILPDDSNKVQTHMYIPAEICCCCFLSQRLSNSLHPEIAGHAAVLKAMKHRPPTRESRMSNKTNSTTGLYHTPVCTGRMWGSSGTPVCGYFPPQSSPKSATEEVSIFSNTSLARPRNWARYRLLLRSEAAIYTNHSRSNQDHCLSGSTVEYMHMCMYVYIYIYK